jgi:hypothetical protein
MIKYFTIYGERCSGTNYLEELIVLNFNSQIKKLIEFKKMNPDKSDEEVFSRIKFISL